MNIETIVSIILSSTVVSSIVAAVFSLLANRKKDYIENITQERKGWRDELRKIVEGINKSENIISLKMEVEKLKVRINPYGQATSLFFDDSYVWEYIDKLKNENDEAKLTNLKSEIISLISCILKHDWERSKEEVRGSTQTRILVISFIISFFLYSIYYFLNSYSFLLTVSDVTTELILPYLMTYLHYCVIIIGATFVCILIINHVDKWKNKAMLIYNVAWGISIVLLYGTLFHFFVQGLHTLSVIGWLTIFNPVLGFLYCFIFKALKYRNDMGRLITTIAMVTNHKIPQRFELFVEKDIFDKVNSGELKKFPFNKSFYEQDSLEQMDGEAL